MKRLMTLAPGAHWEGVWLGSGVIVTGMRRELTDGPTLATEAIGVRMGSRMGLARDGVEGGRGGSHLCAVQLQSNHSMPEEVRPTGRWLVSSCVPTWSPWASRSAFSTTTMRSGQARPTADALGTRLAEGIEVAATSPDVARLRQVSTQADTMRHKVMVAVLGSEVPTPIAVG